MNRQFAELDAGRMAYVSAGKGPALILMHSLGFSADSFSTVRESLARQYTVYALDMLGHGYSDKTPTNYMIEDYGQSVIAFMDKLGLERAFVCGNSIGAFLALEMAVSYPERLSKLILIGLAVRDAWERMERLVLAGRTADPEGNPVTMTADQVATMGFLEMPPERLAWINEQWARAGKWTLKGAIACTFYDVEAKAEYVQCPALIMYGRRDIVRESGKILAERIKGAKYVIVENAGHLPQLDQPEAVVALINDFLSSSG
jgi:pimeloyl-ACP methyl ester carboxylesterase